MTPNEENSMNAWNPTTTGYTKNDGTLSLEIEANPDGTYEAIAYGYTRGATWFDQGEYEEVARKTFPTVTACQEYLLAVDAAAEEII